MTSTKIVRITNSFSEIELLSGSKVLLSITQDEFALFKIGFLHFPTQKLWKYNRNDLMNKIGIFEGERFQCRIISDLELNNCKTLEDINPILSKLYPAV